MRTKLFLLSAFCFLLSVRSQAQTITTAGVTWKGTNGADAFSINPTGSVTSPFFIGDGSQLTNLFFEGLNVKTYGATGNGSSDDTSAFEITMAMARTGSVKTVFVPAGTYVIKRPLFIPSATTLYGVGYPSIITKPASVKCFVTNTVNAGSTSVTLSNVTGFEVNGSIYLADTTSFEWLSTKAVITNITGNTISFNVPTLGNLQTARGGFVSSTFPLLRNLQDGTTNMVIKDLTLNHNSSTNDPSNEFTVATIHYEGNFNARVQNVWMLNAPSDAYSDQATNGLSLTPATNYIRKCANTITGSKLFNAGRHAVHLGTCIEGGFIVNNEMRRCGGFAYFYCAFATYTTASGNIVDECQSGFAGIDYRDYGNVISQNIITGCTNYSIDLGTSGADGTGGRCTITGNSVRGRPIYINQPDCAIVGNIVYPDLSGVGIKLASQADRAVISGNVVYSPGGAGSSCVELISADDVHIIGNTFNGSSKGMDIQGATRMVASGNHLSGQTSTVWLFAGAASTNCLINNDYTTATTPVSENTSPVRLVYNGYGNNGTNDPSVSGWWTNSDLKMFQGTVVSWTNTTSTNLSMFFKGVGWRKLDP